MSNVVVPELGEKIDEAEVVRVLVGAGDHVSAEQPILELEADKAALELPSPRAGTVSAVKVNVGDRVEPGQVVLELDEEDESAETNSADGPAQPAPPEPSPQPAPPEPSPQPAPPEPSPQPAPPEPSPQPAPPEPSPQPAPPEPSPQPAHPERSPGSARAQSKDAESPPAHAPPSAGANGRQISAGPATRRFARELGVSLEDVGTEHVTRDDVVRYVRQQPHPQRCPERTPLTARRRAAARQLAETWRSAPQVTHHDLADVSELEVQRRTLREHEPDLPLTMTALVVKASVAALQAVPAVHVSFDGEAGELLRFRAAHVGIAVDTDRGLLVPVLRDADRKSTREIAQEVATLAERARAGELTGDEMRGATFSVSNLGGIGGVGFTPILNPPGAAILGVSRARQEPRRGDDDAVDWRTMLPLSLSYDHRAIDGADAARFTRRLAELLSSPLALLVEL